jgi:hypothetical protein
MKLEILLHMFVRLIRAALSLCAMFTPAAAGFPDLATLARASGTPQIPGLKIIWLAPATAEQIAAWRILVRVLQARYGIAGERIYALHRIDYKDARYCGGCDLGTLARGAAFCQARALRLAS